MQPILPNNQIMWGCFSGFPHDLVKDAHRIEWTAEVSSLGMLFLLRLWPTNLIHAGHLNNLSFASFHSKLFPSLSPKSPCRDTISLTDLNQALMKLSACWANRPLGLPLCGKVSGGGVCLHGSVQQLHTHTPLSLLFVCSFVWWQNELAQFSHSDSWRFAGRWLTCCYTYILLGHAVCRRFWFTTSPERDLLESLVFSLLLIYNQIYIFFLIGEFQFALQFL